jgi:hypothetical protein
MERALTTHRNGIHSKYHIRSFSNSTVWRIRSLIASGWQICVDEEVLLAGESSWIGYYHTNLIPISESNMLMRDFAVEMVAVQQPRAAGAFCYYRVCHFSLRYRERPKMAGYEMQAG